MYIPTIPSPRHPSLPCWCFANPRAVRTAKSVDLPHGRRSRSNSPTSVVKPTKQCRHSLDFVLHPSIGTSSSSFPDENTPERPDDKKPVAQDKPALTHAAKEKPVLQDKPALLNKSAAGAGAGAGASDKATTPLHRPVPPIPTHKQDGGVAKTIPGSKREGVSPRTTISTRAGCSDGSTKKFPSGSPRKELPQPRTPISLRVPPSGVSLSDGNVGGSVASPRVPSSQSDDPPRAASPRGQNPSSPRDIVPKTPFSTPTKGIPTGAPPRDDAPISPRDYSSSEEEGKSLPPLIPTSPFAFL